MKTADKDAARYCRELVRRQDKDRYLCTLFAHRRDRQGLFALFAFNYELGRIREAVSEEILAEIRFQWWQDAIEGIYGGTTRDHPVVVALARMVERSTPPVSLFLDLITARREGMIGDGFASLAQLEAYAESRDGKLHEIGVYAVGQGGSSEVRTAGRHAGTAWAITGLLRSTRHLAARGRTIVPREDLIAADVSPRSALGPEWPASLSPIIGRIAESARHHIDAVAAGNRLFHPRALPLILPATLARDYLDRLRRAAFDPLVADFSAGAMIRLFKLVRAAMGG